MQIGKNGTDKRCKETENWQCSSGLDECGILVQLGSRRFARMACFRVILILLCFYGRLLSAIEYKLNGMAYITYTLPSPKRSSSRAADTIHMLFRTARPSGLLMHGRGTGGDFFTVEIVRGKLRWVLRFFVRDFVYKCYMLKCVRSIGMRIVPCDYLIHPRYRHTLCLYVHVFV